MFFIVDAWAEEGGEIIAAFPSHKAAFAFRDAMNDLQEDRPYAARCERRRYFVIHDGRRKLLGKIFPRIDGVVFTKRGTL